MRELIETIRRMNESTISETRDYTRAELESIIDDANAVMDDLDGHEQVIVQSAIEDIVAAIESDDLETASEFAEDILEIIAGEDIDELDPDEDFDDDEKNESVVVGKKFVVEGSQNKILEIVPKHDGSSFYAVNTFDGVVVGEFETEDQAQTFIDNNSDSEQERVDVEYKPVRSLGEAAKEYSVAQEDGEWVVKDASGNIVDTATDKLGALQAARDLNSMKQSNRRVVTGRQPQADVEEDYQTGK